MGCDIHWYSETKQDGKWVCDQAGSFEIEGEDTEDAYPAMNNFPDRGRDYWMFGLLQPGVRSSWDWSFSERELDQDTVSEQVKKIIEHWGSDGHSHGFVTRAEILDKIEELKKLRAEHLINPQENSLVLQHHLKRLEECLGHLTSDVPDDDQRIVFFFDN